MILNMKPIRWIFGLGFALLAYVLFSGTAMAAQTYYIQGTVGSDSNPGTESQPFLTINHAAQVAQAGDTVIVKAGTYREWVNPANGGTSDTERITYKAAPGETVYVKGSEQVQNWIHDSGNVYYATLDPQIFGSYNPYTIPLVNPDITQSARDPSTLRTLGEVYLNDVALTETDVIQE